MGGGRALFDPYKIALENGHECNPKRYLEDY